MNLKHSSSSAQVNAPGLTTKIATTTKSIWERLPYNVSMEFHILSNVATTTATTSTVAAAAAAEAVKRLTTKNDQSINKCCQEEEDEPEQLQHQHQHNPPQTTATEATALETFTMKDNYFHSQTLKAAAVNFLSAPFSSSSNSCLDVVDFTTRNEQNVLQPEQEEKPLNNNKFPVDTSDRKTTTTTKLVAQTEAKVTTTNRTTNTTTTRTRKATTTRAQNNIIRCCYEKSNNNNAGDIPQGGKVVAADDSNSTRSNNISSHNNTTRKSNKKHNNTSSNINTAAKMPQRMSIAFQQLQQKDVFLSSAMRRIVLLVLVLTTATQCWAGRQDAPSNCTFPARWEGSWFLSGYQQSIHIKGSQFSYRGKCAASDGNKYLIVDEKGCHRCLVIYEKHKNVLQYKESECEGDSMYLHQTNPSAMAMRSVLKQSGDHSRGGAHPNSNGHSRLSSSDQYIMRSNDDMNDYFCKGRETLQNLCDQIPGDALLYSLFRESAEPVKCPLKGPFVFTYNRGHGECKSPVSNIDSCTEDSRLLLSFQACPDVQGTESTVEELTCLATWKDGNSRYLVGLVSHHHAISNEERYRCFVYEKISSLMGGPGITNSKDAEYKLAQSGDATCNGLDSAEVGSRIMSLRKPPPAERCDFPAWFKGPRHWHALMGNAVYNYHSNDGSMHIIKPNGYMETRALCEQINKQTSTEMMAVVHYTTGCQSGFMCMMFYRRDTHVIEIQTGKPASRLEDACAPDHFDIHRMPYITLLANNPDPQICPLEGLYSLRGAVGPPHISARHKRNHNNNKHTGHGHHHLLQHDFSAGGMGVVAGTGADSGTGGSIGNAASAFGHKRRSAMSFRHAEAAEHSSWHSQTRGLPIRRRREVSTTTTTTTTITAKPTTFAASDFDDDGGPATGIELKPDAMKNYNKYTSSGSTDDGDDEGDYDHDAGDDDDDDGGAKRNFNHVAILRDGVETRGFKGASTKHIDFEDSLSKFSHSNNNNDNDNNKNNFDKFTNKSNRNRKSAAESATFTEKEQITSTSKSPPGTETQLQQQQQPGQVEEQPRLLSTISSTATRPAAATSFRTTELEVVVNDMINNVAADDFASGSNAAANHAIAALSNRVAFVAAASATQQQQRSRRDAPGCVVNYKAQRQLWIGCTAPNLIDVRPQCNEDGDEEYSCHGSWAENGTVYIIARHKGSKHGVCISYRPLEGAAAQLIVGDACYRGASLLTEHPLAANLTAFGKCGDTSSAPPNQQHPPASTVAANVFVSVILATLLTRLLSHTHCRPLPLRTPHTAR